MNKGTVFIDALSIGGRKITGVGRYTYEIINEFAQLNTDIEFKILVPPKKSVNWDISNWETVDSFHLIEKEIPAVGPMRQIHYLINKYDHDVFHSTTSYLPLGIKGKKVVTIHDLKHIKSNEFLSNQKSIKKKYIDMFIRAGARNADAVITVSNHTAKAVNTYLDIDESAIHPIHLGPSRLPKCKTKLQQYGFKYILAVGELRPHKNYTVLIDAFERLKVENDRKGMKLIIVGSDYESEKSNLISMIDDSIKEDVIFTGRVSDQELACLYSQATSFIFPSKYEGFGLPLLEAMQHELPVIASNVTSLPEIGGQAAIYFNPDDHIQLCNKIEKLLSDRSLREKYSKMSKNRYHDFNWRNTAEKTLTVYSQFL